MAPIGIIMFGNENINIKRSGEWSKDKSQIDIKKKKLNNKKDEIDQLVNINWYGIRSGKSKYIIPEKSYISYLNNHQIKFDKVFYDEIVNKCKSLKIIDEKRIILNKDENKVRQILYKQLEKGKYE